MKTKKLATKIVANWGFSIDELKGLLSLVDSEGYTCGEVLAVINIHIKDIPQKISNLKRVERTLSAIEKNAGAGKCPITPSSILCLMDMYLKCPSPNPRFS